MSTLLILEGAALLVMGALLSHLAPVPALLVGLFGLVLTVHGWARQRARE